MLLYHGSSLEIKVPQILAGKYAKDFGSGFYCTVLKEQAMRWASRYETPVLNTYSYEKGDSLQAREFPEMTEEWLGKPTHQIAFCSRAALKCLKFARSEAAK